MRLSKISEIMGWKEDGRGWFADKNGTLVSSRLGRAGSAGRMRVHQSVQDLKSSHLELLGDGDRRLRLSQRLGHLRDVLLSSSLPPPLISLLLVFIVGVAALRTSPPRSARHLKHRHELSASLNIPAATEYSTMFNHSINHHFSVKVPPSGF